MTTNVYEIEKGILRKLVATTKQFESNQFYFEVYGLASMNEYVVDGNIAPTGYIWGYLASRK